MTDVELVIKIPEENYERIKFMEEMGALNNPYLETIANGAPLPKEHGRLIDGDALLVAFEADISKQTKYMELLKSVDDIKRYFDILRVQDGMVSCRRLLDNADTIIEADKAESEGEE